MAPLLWRRCYMLVRARPQKQRLILGRKVQRRQMPSDENKESIEVHEPQAVFNVVI